MFKRLIKWVNNIGEIPIDKNQIQNRFCYVCGYDFIANNKTFIKPLESMCGCCWFHFGIDTTTYGKDAIMHYRKDWVSKGLPYDGELKPKEVDWTLDIALKQLENLKQISINEYPHKITIDENKTWSSTLDIDFIRENWGSSRLDS